MEIEKIEEPMAVTTYPRFTLRAEEPPNEGSGARNVTLTCQETRGGEKTTVEMVLPHRDLSGAKFPDDAVGRAMQGLCEKLPKEVRRDAWEYVEEVTEGDVDGFLGRGRG